MNDNSNKKRLAVNTIILYFKLIVTTVISFFTSRLVLDALGASDYGLYNVVGGVVTMLNTIGVGMVATSYRYMAVEIGKGETGNPNKIYNTIFVIHIVLALFLIVVGESLGVYYVNHFLNVAEGKTDDALFVLHLSLITAALSVVTVPVYGLTIARERFMFTSIVDVVCALLRISLIFFLLYYDGNKLRLFAILVAFVGVISPIAFTIYCKIKDQRIVRWCYNWSWDDYKEILSFAWWILLGAIACLATIQGASVVINLFFGTLLNAAFGLASQLYAATSQFTSTMRQAAVPQIMKSFSSGEEDKSLSLVYIISRFSFMFLLIAAVPLIVCIDGTLQLWLGTPPLYTNIFIVLLLVNGLISNLGSGFDASIQASGKIKKNQIGYSLINVSLIPIVFVMYKLGCPPYSNVIVMVLLTTITLVFQSNIMTELTSFSYSVYFMETIYPALKTAIFAFVPAYFVSMLFDNSHLSVLFNLVVVLLWAILAVLIAGLRKKEKEMLLIYLSKIKNEVGFKFLL